MLTPYTERQKTTIVNNVVRAVKNPDKLSKQAYKYLYLCSGFIAHYNHAGFIAHYREPGKLFFDILQRHNWNKWENFRPADNDYFYYRSKADIYNRIVYFLTKGV
jgi:hypothetical protein